MGGYRLTVRHGSSVERESFQELDEALGAIERRVREIQSEGPLGEINALRDYDSGQRVHARLELSAGGLLRGQRERDLDVVGLRDLAPANHRDSLPQIAGCSQSRRR